VEHPFEPGHMHERWLPFFSARTASVRPAQAMDVEAPRGQWTPWALYGIYVAFALLCWAVMVFWR